MASEQLQKKQELPVISAATSDKHCAEVGEQPLCFKVKRGTEDKQGMVDEVLILEGLEAPNCQQSVNVFINLPNADEKTTSNCIEYVGNFYCLSGQHSAQQRFSIRKNLEQLGLTNAPEITITVVPKGSDKHIPIPFKGAKIEKV